MSLIVSDHTYSLSPRDEPASCAEDEGGLAGAKHPADDNERWWSTTRALARVSVHVTTSS
jgi:hypothetical protein